MLGPVAVDDEFEEVVKWLEPAPVDVVFEEVTADGEYGPKVDIFESGDGPFGEIGLITDWVGLGFPVLGPPSGLNQSAPRLLETPMPVTFPR
jgi:hypothetical protein